MNIQSNNNLFFLFHDYLNIDSNAGIISDIEMANCMSNIQTVIGLMNMEQQDNDCQHDLLFSCISQLLNIIQKLVIHSNKVKLEQDKQSIVVNGYSYSLFISESQRTALKADLSKFDADLHALSTRNKEHYLLIGDLIKHELSYLNNNNQPLQNKALKNVLQWLIKCYFVELDNNLTNVKLVKNNKIPNFLNFQIDKEKALSIIRENGVSDSDIFNDCLTLTDKSLNNFVDRFNQAQQYVWEISQTIQKEKDYIKALQPFVKRMADFFNPQNNANHSHINHFDMDNEGFILLFICFSNKFQHVSLIELLNNMIGKNIEVYKQEMKVYALNNHVDNRTINLLNNLDFLINRKPFKGISIKASGRRKNKLVQFYIKSVDKLFKNNDETNEDYFYDVFIFKNLIAHAINFLSRETYVKVDDYDNLMALSEKYVNANLVSIVKSEKHLNKIINGLSHIQSLGLMPFKQKSQPKNYFVLDFEYLISTMNIYNVQNLTEVPNMKKLLIDKISELDIKKMNNVNADLNKIKPKIKPTIVMSFKQNNQVRQFAMSHSFAMW